MSRYSSLPDSTSLHPERDHVAICHRLVGYDFPWDFRRSLELAILRTFCVPRISATLSATGEFLHRPQKRYDDTGLIIGNILKWGYDSPRGRAAIAQMNWIHHRYAIANEDFLYVLSTLIYEPIRWNQHYGWRPFTVVERQALFHFWRAVGQRMAIADIPTSDAHFEAFNRAYEATHFVYSPENHRLAAAILALMQSWFPAITAPLIPLVVKALVDDSLRRALGWSRPPAWVCQGVTTALQWSRPLRRGRPRRGYFPVDAPTRTYPHGYVLEQLGPTAAEQAATARSRCPFLRMRSWLKTNG